MTTSVHTQDMHHEGLWRQTVDVLACEARAVESGARARRTPAGTYLVRSETRDLRWEVSVYTVRRPDGLVLLGLRCSCESGTYRPDQLVPCWHAALVARRLEREHQATWIGGLWAAEGPWLEQHDDTAEPPAPPVRRAQGRCVYCNKLVRFELRTGDEQPSDHTPECVARREKGSAEWRARFPDGFDLWA